MATPAPIDQGPDPPQLAEPDHELLQFMAEHRLVEVAHVVRLLGTTRSGAFARLRRLGSAGYVRREQPFGGRTTFHLINTKGLRRLKSPLRAPRFDLGCHEHDIGVAWLWLAARAGTFGPVSEVISERRMRSLDATAPPAGRPHAVRLGGVGAGGRERLHYPDLLLITPQGKRVAVELELSSKGRRRREQILSGYAADVRVDAVLYLVKSRQLGRAIQASARRMDIAPLVHVQMTSLGATSAGAAGGRVLARQGPRTGAATPTR